MTQPQPTLSISSIDTTSRLPRLYTVEGLTSLGATLLMSGIFFFTKNRLGWNLRENFLLAMCQGIVYIGGSLLAERLASRFGRRSLLSGLYLLMALLCAVAISFPVNPTIIATVLIIYTFFCANSWPALESLVSTGANPKELSSRLGLYNFVWAGTGALAIAINGALIEYFPRGVFLVPLCVHATSACLIFGLARKPLARKKTTTPLIPHEPPTTSLLLQQHRTQALWLSRLCLPATYLVIYSLMAIMPSLPLIKSLSVTASTLLCCIWLFARWGAFLVLRMSTWWHSRPWLLLVAAVALLLSFLGIVIPATLMHNWIGSDILWIILAQITLGIALGIIYSGSLYFGMVLSEGSTEHGGYHEALIGLGSVLGPGSGFLTQTFFPNNIWAGILAVTTLTAATALAATAATFLLRPRRDS